ncbi:MAG: class I SAM-dependent methyltransferase [Gemmatimonadaceae bacterium]
MTDSRDHFSPQASEYAAFRPTYPIPFIAHIASLARQHDLAWDVGTGSGQAAVLLGEHFSHVHATDASDRQVQFAKPHSHVRYATAPAEQSGLGDASVDLVSVAQALHWFANDAFYGQVNRVLKPDGVIAAWSYDLFHVDAVVDAVVDWFYRDRVGRYWPAERRHVETHYTELPFPFAELALEEWNIEASRTREQVMGYVSTWSALRHARDAEQVDPLTEFSVRLREVWTDDAPRLARWPLIVRAGRKTHV